jgi:hypothetical protein
MAEILMNMPYKVLTQLWTLQTTNISNLLSLNGVQKFLVMEELHNPHTIIPLCSLPWPSCTVATNFHGAHKP